MSFFGFDASGHNKAAPGFSQAHDPFAGLRGSNADALEFEDTYDGLGDQLDETDDAFNDDTFGGGSSNVVKVGKDFDFFGQTAKVADAIEEEHVRFTRQHPAPKPAPPVRPTPAYQFPSQPAPKPARSGYEKYKDSEPVPELQADAALWGVAPKKQAAAAAAQAPAAPAPSSARKIMSLEEVEAAMRAQTRTSVPPEPSPIPVHQEAQPHVIQHPSAPQQQTDLLHGQQQHIPQPAPSPSAYGQPQDGLASQSVPQMTILQRPQSKHSPVPGVRPAHAPSATTHQHQQQHQNQQQQHRQALDQRQAPGPHQHQPTQQHAAASVKPTQILQNPNRLSGDANRIGMVGSVFPPHPTQHRQQGSFSHPAIVTHSSQLSQFSEEEKSAYLEQEARRAKRNHKVFMLSKDNGLMTPQDKNFITRIQLQQLVAATGNPIEQATDDNIAEDFYYQVHNQIRGSQRQHPGQPLSNFAQTYLYQTGSRQTGARRQQRGPENHVQRMEQQVQRAVEAAKNKPKNKQLIIEGSLGKISFSNAKTPKPLLNIKRADSSPDINRRPGSAGGGHPQSAVVDPKAVLGDVEKVYDTLMEMEDHDRKMPPPGSESTDPELAQRRSEWAQRAEQLNARLWRELKVHEPLGATLVHPFIAFLSCGKGKKAIPRVFRHTTHEQRTTILTMIVVHLDQLDIVRGAQSETGDTRLNAALREKIDLFSVAVMGTLFNFMSELGLDIVTGVLGLISTLNVDLIARTRIGASMLTMILSRAEILKQAGTEQNQLESWTSTYNNFFNLLEPTLPRLFPGPVNSGQDIYVWQLLAALGIGANQDQQQRLVLGVKDRVMDTVALSKTLPQEMAQPRLQNVNLFMRSIGLDVELLV